MQHDAIVIQFGELWLKGRNRNSFIFRLFDNVSAAVGKTEYTKLSKERDRFILYLKKGADTGEILSALSFVPGISYFAPVLISKPEVNDILKTSARLGLKHPVKIDASRTDKSLKFDSREIVGEFLKNGEKLGLKLDKDAERRLYIKVMSDKALLFTEKINGVGGLPVGSSGRAVILLSGGIDSPVASFYAMKRGLSPIYLHMHTFPNNDLAVNSKIPKMVDKLTKYSNASKTYYAPAHLFQAATAKIPNKFELVLFKRFMYKLADKVAKEEGAKAIVTGESLGQVASQTVENMHSSQRGVKSLILRPLTGMDKNEIIKKARELGTYDLSIEAYRDVCSIKIKNPATRADPDTIDRLYRACKLSTILTRTYKGSRKEIS